MDKRVFHAFRLTEQHKSNKQSVGKAQPMLTRVGGGGWIVANAGPGQVFEYAVVGLTYDVVGQDVQRRR